MRHVYISGLFVACAFALAVFPATAIADCTEKQVKKYYAGGMSITKIAKRCEMEEADVEEIVGEDEPGPPQKGAGKGRSPAQRQAFCCDGFGNSRCAIVQGSTAIGGQCFCPGQGYGVICR